MHLLWGSQDRPSQYHPLVGAGRSLPSLLHLQDLLSHRFDFGEPGHGFLPVDPTWVLLNYLCLGVWVSSQFGKVLLVISSIFFSPSLSLLTFQDACYLHINPINTFPRTRVSVL